MEPNIKDKRILKLWNRGLSIQQIARKIGCPENPERVIDGLKRCDVDAATILHMLLMR